MIREELVTLLQITNTKVVMTFEKIHQLTGISTRTLDQFRKDKLLLKSDPFGSRRVASLDEIYEIYKNGQR